MLHFCDKLFITKFDFFSLLLIDDHFLHFASVLVILWHVLACCSYVISSKIIRILLSRICVLDNCYHNTLFTTNDRVKSLTLEFFSSRRHCRTSFRVDLWFNLVLAWLTRAFLLHRTFMSFSKTVHCFLRREILLIEQSFLREWDFLRFVVLFLLSTMLMIFSLLVLLD